MEKTKAALKLLELASSQISPSYKDELSKKTKDIIGLNFDELVDDVGLLSIPSEYMLDTQAGMAKFLVDFYVGTVESISSQIESVKEMMIKQEKGEIRGIKEAIQRAYDNPKNKIREYENIQVKLDSGYCTRVVYSHCEKCRKLFSYFIMSDSVSRVFVGNSANRIFCI
ncbi:hypothetical protein J4O15_01965 [Lachnoanaerobaculum sp. Marseille-Q4761]|uniref:hypothetical protein n=1 Tax=Lachnoanaerobaculum sp. Marseille-Q4761 TaxID=2819511 RepID=UPI001AA18F92|nr:hypothetical protein [Lachnoanaerobaculum sp. Marseille-Q4761]MBO1869746.1 hypothetical protein [Lachnoanaerobaculum sp. Marseille-Q4761]